MKLRLLAFALGATLAFNAAAVDSVVVGYSPRTGDAFVDTRLGDVNVFARGNTDGFIDDVVLSYGAPRYLVRELYYDKRWAPGDIYYACLIASILKRPCGYVVDVYVREHGKGKGWGALAKRLGIKPGSAEFHALKNGVSTGYVRMKDKSKKDKGGKVHDMGHDKGGKHDHHGPVQGHDKDSGKGNGKGKGKGKG